MSRAWMPLYVADYLADTAHLSAAESGAYLHLIMHYWQTGGLPHDDAQLARIARMTEREWKLVRATISAFFKDEWQHARIDHELSESDAAYERRANAGRKGGLSRRQRSSNATSNASSLVEQPPPQSQATAAKAAAAGPPPLDLNELRRACVEAAGQDFTKGFGMIAELAEAGHSVDDRILPIIREAAADLAARGEKARSWAYFAEAIMDEHRAAPAAPAPLVEHVWCEKGSPEFERGNAARVARGEAPWSGFPSRHHNGAVGASFPASDVREERAQA